MKTEILLTCLIISLIYGIVSVSEYINHIEPRLLEKVDKMEMNRTITIKWEHNPRGAILQPLEKNKERVIIKEIGNIPLRTQVGPACGPISLAMVMDWLDKPYKNQKYYDRCTYRNKDEWTYVYQLKACAAKLGIDTSEEWNYDIDKLKTGDIVLYHVMGYDNSSDLHFSVVDSIDEEFIRLADPNHYYHEHTIEEFEQMYYKRALIYMGE